MTWATSVPILVFLVLSVLDLGLYATDRRQTHHRLMPRLLGAGAKQSSINNRFHTEVNLSVDLYRNFCVQVNLGL